MSKSGKFDPCAVIQIDWKSPGRDFLPLFQAEYPDYDFLQSQSFETLIDELSSQSATECLEALAAWLAPHQHGLWNVDTGGDDYLLAIVPKSKARQFTQYWTQGYKADLAEGDVDFSPSLQQFKGKQTARKSTGKPKARFSWAEDIFHHRSYGMLDLRDDCSRVFVKLESDADKAPIGLIDFSVWPPQHIQLPERFAEQMSNWLPVNTSPQRSLWKQAWSRRDDRVKFGDVVGFDPWQFNPWESGGVKLHGFFSASKPFGDGVLHVSGNTVFHVTPAQAEPWFHGEDELSVFVSPNGRECLILQGNRRHALARGPVTDEAFSLLPVEAFWPDHGVFFIDEDEIVYFSEIQRPNAQRPEMPERVLQMNRLHLRTGVHRACVLEGLWAEQTIDKIKHRSFEGDLDIRKGHADWWVFNYVTNYFGAKDLAWLWNARTNEVIKVRKNMFPRLEPRILYLPELGRYVAEDSCNLIMLKEFAELYGSESRHVLQWGSAENSCAGEMVAGRATG